MNSYEAIKWTGNLVKARIELDQLKLEQFFAKNRLLPDPLHKIIADYVGEDPAVIDILVESHQVILCKLCSGSIVIETIVNCYECNSWTFNLGHSSHEDNHFWDWWIEGNSVWDALFMFGEPKINLNSNITNTDVVPDYYSAVVKMRRHLYQKLQVRESPSSKVISTF